MSEIPYCELTWALTAGCTKCELGCLNCWAIRSVQRLKGKGIRGYEKVVDKNGWTGHIELMPWNIERPLHWKKSRRIFVNSMSDLFHPKVNIGYLTHVFDIIKQCPQHTFLIFTKRPEQVLKMMWGKHGEGWRYFGKGDFHPNIQFILSLSTQKEADEKIPILLQISAAVRGLSLEPLLGPIDLAGTDKSRMGKTGYLANYFIPFFCNHCGKHISKPPDCITSTCRYCGGHGEGHRREKSIHWIIVGCESGSKRRPCKIEWVRSIVQQCQAANVPVYVKQLSIDGKVARRNKDGSWPTMWPKDLRIQQYP